MTSFLLLCGRKKTSTWWSTVAGCLSVGSPTFFRSGAQEFGEPGWWKLVQNRPPTLRPEVDKSTTKTKGDPHLHPTRSALFRSFSEPLAGK